VLWVEFGKVMSKNLINGIVLPKENDGLEV
jgi:hypothetical protein